MCEVSVRDFGQIIDQKYPPKIIHIHSFYIIVQNKHNIFRFLVRTPRDIARAEELCDRPEFCITLYLDSHNIKVKYLNSDSERICILC